MQIVTLIGPVCSGKSYRLKNEYSQFRKIEVGDIVRDIKQQQGRIFDMSLDQQIIVRLHNEIEISVQMEDDLIISGIRQLSILKEVETFIKALKRVPINNITNYSRIYLDTNRTTRYERFVRRVDVKDRSITFDQVEAQDGALGLSELTDFCLNIDKNNTQIIKS